MWIRGNKESGIALKKKKKKNQNFSPPFIVNASAWDGEIVEKSFEAFREERREARKKSVTILGRSE